MLRNRPTPRIALIALTALLLGSVVFAASATPVAAQDDEQTLQVEYEYDVDYESHENVTITLTLKNPDEIEEEISVWMFDYVSESGFEDLDSDKWHPEPGAETATVTYTREFDSLVIEGPAISPMVGEDGSWAVLKTDFTRVSDGDSYDVSKSYDLPDGRLFEDDEHILLGSAEGHTAHGDTATITVFGSPVEMPESPRVVAERLADVSDEAEAGVLDHHVTAYAVPSVRNASGRAYGTRTHYTEMGTSVEDGGNTWFHEYVHNTDGTSVSGSDGQMKWFTEAYADYGAQLYGVRAGHWTYWEFVEGIEAWNEDEAVVLANEEEWDDDADNEAEYNQGSRVLAAIDYELRKTSAENDSVDATIDDVVREMHERDQVDLDAFTTIVENVSTPEVANQAETWITTEHDEDVFEPWGVREFEELYVDAPEFDGLAENRTVVGRDSDAQDPAQPVLIDENASSLVVYTVEPFHTVTVETADGEVVADTVTHGDRFVEVDATALDRSTTYEVTIESQQTGAETTQYVSTLDPVEGAVPRDLDGDGLHEDMNGDGSVTNTDVNVFFGNQHAPEMQAHSDAYDFDGDGDLGQSDVIAFYEEL